MRQLFRALMFISVLSFALAAMATNVTVDCNASQTINGALSTLDNQGPHTISVSGNCVENVVVAQRERVSIFAAPGTTLTPATPNGRPLNIIESQSIAVDGFTITGGRGVAVQQNSTANLSNLDVSGSAATGIIITEGSRVNASVLHVHNNTRTGVAVSGESSLVIDTSNIESNGVSGFSVTNSRLLVFGGDGTPGSETYIRNNTNNGIGASTTGYVELDGDVRVQNNGSNGILAIHTVSLFVFGPLGFIENNGGSGIYVGETSHGEIDSITIRNNGSNSGSATGRDGVHVVDNADFYIDSATTITGNAGNGVTVDTAGVFNSVGTNTINSNGGDGVFFHANATGHWTAADTIVGNGGNSITCDDSSFVFGDLTGVNGIKCKNVEKTSGNPHGAAGTRRGPQI